MKYMIDLKELALRPLDADVRTALALEAIAERLERLVERMEREQESAAPKEPTACIDKSCSYYNHYLAYGPADLTHEGYHAAEKKCAEAQEQIAQHTTDCAACKEAIVPCWSYDVLNKIANEWEVRVRA